MGAVVKRSDCSAHDVCMCMCICRHAHKESINCVHVSHLMIDVVDLTGLQILILAAFVMISSGVVLHLYSFAITSIRQGLIIPTPQGQGLLSASYAMFAGSLLENLFLVSLKIYVRIAQQMYA